MQDKYLKGNDRALFTIENLPPLNCVNLMSSTSSILSRQTLQWGVDYFCSQKRKGRDALAGGFFTSEPPGKLYIFLQSHSHSQS